MVYASSGTHLNIEEDASNPADANVQPQSGADIAGGTGTVPPPSTSQLVVVEPAKALKKVSVVKARRISRLHETVAVAFALTGLGIGYLAWRLSEGTISISAASPLVESSLERIVGGKTRIGSLRLGWDHARRDFVVTANQITATTDARTSPLALGQVNLTLNARALLVGRAQITNARLSGLQAVLVLDNAGRSAFGFGTADEVLNLPRTKGESRSLRALLDMVRQTVLPDGARGRVEAITLTNARLIVIDPDTGQRLTLANARANVSTNANDIVTMQAAGSALEMGGFANIAISSSPDARQRLVLAATLDQARLSRLPSSLKLGPLARFNGDTAPLSGKILVQLGEQIDASNVKADFSLGRGRFQGVDLDAASGTLVWDGPTDEIYLTNVSANSAQGGVVGAKTRLSGLRRGVRSVNFDANSLVFLNSNQGDVSARDIVGTAVFGKDFGLISASASADGLTFNRQNLANLRIRRIEAALKNREGAPNGGAVLTLKTQNVLGTVLGRDLTATGVVANVEGVRRDSSFVPSQLTASATQFASSFDLDLGRPAFDAKDIRMVASQFGTQIRSPFGVPSTLSVTASSINVASAQISQLNASASGVAFEARNLATQNTRASGTIERLRSNTATGSRIVFDATQISPTSARLNTLTADALGVVVNGVSVGTVGLSANGLMMADRFSNAVMASDSIEITSATQLPRPFWADDVRLRGSIGLRTAALEAFSFRHRGVNLRGATTIALAPQGSPRVDLVADVGGEFSVQTLLSAWPRRLLPDTRGAIVRLVPSGSARVSRLSLAIPAGMKPKEILPRSGMDLAFNLRDLTVTYLPGMSPITNLSGEGAMTGNSLLINLSQGAINDMALSNGIVEIAAFKASGAIATIRAKVDGNVIDMAREIDLPPLALLSKAKLEPDRLTGVGSATLDLTVPLKPALAPGEVGVVASGNFEQAGLTRVFAGLDATEATVHLDVVKDKVDIWGDALVLGNVFDFSWVSTSSQDATPQTRLLATGEVAVADLSAVGLDLRTYATGPITLNVDSNSQGSQFGAAVLNADLRNTNIILPGKLWNKVEGVAATASANLYPREGGGWNVQDLRFDSAGAILRGALDLSDDARLVDARFSRVVIPNAGDLAVNVTPADAGLTVTLRGEYLNLSPFLRTKNVSEKAVDFLDRPLNLSADIKRVSTSEENVLTNVHADIVRDLQGWRTLSANGDSPAGSSQIKLMIERDGRRSISGVLSDAGFFAQLLYPGAPLFGGTGTIEGELPVVGANSSGILTFTGKDITLARQGTSPILFDNVRMPMSVRGGVVTLRDGQADGNAYTVKASGYVDVGAGRLDLRGVATPGGLNRALADIPLFGAILGGGTDEGLLGITFAAKGSMTAPRISINPVSAFAPGFLRKLFESEAPLSPQPRLVVTKLAGDPIVTKWPYGPTEDMTEAANNSVSEPSFGPIQ